MILKRIFAQVCAFSWTKVKRFFGRVFDILTDFLVQKCKNQLFEENKRFERSLYGIEVQVIINLSSLLENHQTLDILLMTDFS